jgi:hypothetical protein
VPCKLDLRHGDEVLEQHPVAVIEVLERVEDERPQDDVLLLGDGPRLVAVRTNRAAKPTPPGRMDVTGRRGHRRLRR